MLISGILFLCGTLGFIAGVLMTLYGIVTLNLSVIGQGLIFAVGSIIAFFIGVALRSMGGQTLFPFDIFKMGGSFKKKTIAFFKGLLGEILYLLITLVIIGVISYFVWLLKK